MTTPEPTGTSLEIRFAEHQARLAQMSFPHALGPGDRAPEFELPNGDGRRIRLSDQLERGPVVLTFYRGAWCPFCNLQLRGLQNALPEIEALGASLLAVSPQLPDGSRAMRDENALAFKVLSDPNSFVASTYGIVFALTPADQALFIQIGNDLPKRNGDNSWLLPAPATFVIAGDGIIRREVSTTSSEPIPVSVSTVALLRKRPPLLLDASFSLPERLRVPPNMSPRPVPGMLSRLTPHDDVGPIGAKESSWRTDGSTARGSARTTRSASRVHQRHVAAGTTAGAVE